MTRPRLGPSRPRLLQLALQPVTPDSLHEMLGSDDPPKRVKARFVLDQLDRGEELVTSYAAPIQVVRFGHELLLIACAGRGRIRRRPSKPLERYSRAVYG